MDWKVVDPGHAMYVSTDFSGVIYMHEVKITTTIKDRYWEFSTREFWQHPLSYTASIFAEFPEIQPHYAWLCENFGPDWGSRWGMKIIASTLSYNRKYGERRGNSHCFEFYFPKRADATLFRLQAG